MSPRRVSTMALLALLPLAALGEDPAAPKAPPDNVFLLTGQFLLETDGTTDRTARVYAKAGRPGFLVECAKLPEMVLVDPTAKAVLDLDVDLVLAVGEEGRRVMPGAGGKTLCALVPDGPTAGFSLAGHEFRLVPAPAVLGPTSHQALLSSSPEYRRTAADYEPSSADLQTIGSCRVPVQVDVFFGSWCGFCSRYVPRLLKVLESVENPSVTVVFHGVPQRIALDPDAAALRVTAVPTAVLTSGGREIGRIEGDGWHQPEVALAALLGTLR